MRYFILASFVLSGCSSNFAPHYQLNKDLYNNHTYISDQRKFGKPDVWEIDCNVGDCESISLCLMRKLGEDSQMAMVQVGDLYHAVVWHDGWYYDPTYGYSGRKPREGKVLFHLPYNMAFQRAALHEATR